MDLHRNLGDPQFCRDLLIHQTIDDERYHIITLAFGLPAVGDRAMQIARDVIAVSGKTDKPGGAENVIEITVSPAGGAPYTVTTNQYIYPSNPFSEGENVTVKVDPDDPNVLMIFGHA